MEKNRRRFPVKNHNHASLVSPVYRIVISDKFVY